MYHLNMSKIDLRLIYVSRFYLCPGVPRAQHQVPRPISRQNGKTFQRFLVELPTFTAVMILAQTDLQMIIQLMHTKLTAGFQSAFSFLSLSPQAFPASPFWRWQCSRSPPNRRHIVCFCLPQGGLKLVEAFSPDVDHFLSKIYGHTLRPLLTNFAVVNVLDGKTLTIFFPPSPHPGSAAAPTVS